MQFGESVIDLAFNSWDVAFVGTAVDERGQKALDFINANSKELIVVKYIAKEFKIYYNSNQIDKDDITVYLSHYKDKNILIDSTTMNFAEVLILMGGLKEIGVANFSVTYVEPKKYRKKSKPTDILHMRDFELSETVVGYEAIPGHALLITSEIPQKVIFLCGFEAERIDRALEDSEILGSTCCLIFGVPAITPGWEMDSFDNNISVIKERRMTGGINFCGATNPVAVFDKLEDIYSSLDDEEQLFIVPLATKPMNIGACLFILSKPKNKVAVLYDHPQEIKNKAIEISKWHLYNITL